MTLLALQVDDRTVEEFLDALADLLVSVWQANQYEKENHHAD